MGSGCSGLPELALGYPYQYPRGSHSSWATIIIALDCWQSGMRSLGISGIPR